MQQRNLEITCLYSKNAILENLKIDNQIWSKHCASVANSNWAQWIKENSW